MSDVRPNPDQLLAQVKNLEAEAKRGSLKIFFGYAAGVGKTYAMLETARHAVALGREVVVGYIEPHARPETQALVAGLEVLPVAEIEYRGVVLREFDVDVALARQPDLILVDELAHTNAEGCRHEKRWQDIEELLDAGINVWTTLNVQHIESLNDVIGQITGVVVRETVPDRVFDLADDLELVDLTPEELLMRLSAGKIYVPEQAQRAIQSFFQKGNLTALRELSLRQAARRIHTDVESARRSKSVNQPWATSERLLVCVGPSPTTARVIRTAKRMAAALDAPWLAVSIDLTGESASSQVKQRIAQHFRQAEGLGAETVTLPGQDVTGTILEYARSRNVTKILIGKTKQPRWKRLLFGSVVDEILEQSEDIDVYVIHGEDAQEHLAISKRSAAPTKKLPYVMASVLIALTACLAYALQLLNFSDAEANSVMLFLAAVAWAAARYGRGPAILASVLAVLVFDFFFVPPFHTFAVSDAQYVVTFAVMLIIGIVISTLTSRLRAQVESTRLRESRTAALYELGKKLSSLYGNVFLASAAGVQIAEMLSAEVAIYLQQSSETAEVVYGQNSVIAKHAVSLPVAQWVIQHDQIAGAGTNTLPNAIALFLPLIGSQRTHGAIAIRATDAQRLLEPDVRRLLEACASQLALALERDQLAIDAAEARIQAETEQVRSSLLSSVSHDLKTPLAAIAGASSSLLESTSHSENTRRQLLESISDEAVRLNRLLENILQMSKLDAGAAAPNRQWHVLEEIVGSALHRTTRALASHQVSVNMPADLPLVFVDGLLIEQAFVNLLENAALYTPPGSQVAISASVDGQSLRISIVDNGPGLPVSAEDRVFDKFYRAFPAADSGRGSGLGLAICRAIIFSHGSRITASNRPGGGAEFVIRLPLSKDAPQVVIE
ncbi:MAG: sensor histidine kinase KdpD [Planctomycetota bacterium]|nr:sensor histidine kinase KdpD [Planctomycetota bacterium]